ncbi:MAG TPA: hypothetical protein VLX68_07125 [Chitinivibrionales bacterium]|nr:hypothetical protein [Chitinivibrionales bacterium]
MEYRKITSNEEWRELWLGKFSTEMKNRGFTDEDTKKFVAVLTKYLTDNPGNPREIDIKKMKRFVKGHKSSAIPPLVLFYDAIARSEKHCEVLAAIPMKPHARRRKKKPSS